MMDAHFSQRVNDILGYSKEEAIRLGNSHISPEHLFLGILREGEGLAVDILLNNGVDLLMLKGSIEKSIKADKLNCVHQVYIPIFSFGPFVPNLSQN